MSTKLFTNAINAYAEFLKAGTSYAHAMQAVAKSLGGTPCPTLLEGLAKVHAERYGCNYTWDNGRAVFFEGAESTRESRRDDARKSWSRNVMVWFTPEKPKAPASNARISAEARKAAKAYLAQFDSFADALNALRAVK
jgi:hypothetical protein